MPANHLWALLVSGSGMMLVAVIAAVFWWRFSRAQLRWFWVGAGLWTIAVALKIVCSLLTNAAVLGSLKGLTHPLYVALGALYVGVQSSVFEMGFTLLAVLIWRQLGRDANRAIAVGVGAGAFEAFLLGLGALVGGITLMVVRGPATEDAIKGLQQIASLTPLLWLIGTVERVIAILCHASSRALILLGVTQKKHALVFWGFLIFTLLDGIAGGAHVGGFIGKVSTWWIELAILPFGLVSIPILVRCYRRWGDGAEKHESDAALEPLLGTTPQDEGDAGGGVVA
jgi:hypothetical protein